MTPASFEHGNLEGKFYKLLTRHLESKGHRSVGEVGVLISKQPLKPFGCFCTPLTIRKPVLNFFEIIPRLRNLSHLKVSISCKIHDLRNMTALMIGLFCPQPMLSRDLLTGWQPPLFSAEKKRRRDSYSVDPLSITGLHCFYLLQIFLSFEIQISKLKSAH